GTERFLKRLDADRSIAGQRLRNEGDLHERFSVPFFLRARGRIAKMCSSSFQVTRSDRVGRIEDGWPAGTGEHVSVLLEEDGGLVGPAGCVEAGDQGVVDLLALRAIPQTFSEHEDLLGLTLLLAGDGCAQKPPLVPLP